MKEIDDGEIDNDNEAPGELGTVLAFLNTLDERSYARHGVRRTGGDALVTPAALSTLLAERGLVASGTRVTRLDLAHALELRAALRGILLAQVEDCTDRSLFKRADTTLAGWPLQIRIGHDGAPRLASADRGVPAALASIAVAATQAEARGAWKRMKMCAAADCRWVFFDSSRNGGGRWCSMAVCGNRDKTNKYRQRHASSK